MGQLSQDAKQLATKVLKRVLLGDDVPLDGTGAPQRPPATEQQIRDAIKNTTSTRLTPVEKAATEKFLRSDATKADLRKLCTDFTTEKITENLSVIYKDKRDRVDPETGKFLLSQAYLFDGKTGDSFNLILSEQTGSKKPEENYKSVSISKNSDFMTLGALDSTPLKEVTPKQQLVLAEFIKSNCTIEEGTALPKDFPKYLSFTSKSEIEPTKNQNYESVSIVYKKEDKSIDLGTVRIKSKDTRLIESTEGLPALELNEKNIKSLAESAGLKLPPKP